MATKFQIEYQPGGSVRITSKNSRSQIYRMPFELLTHSKCEFDVKNPFIVYILYAYNPVGRDYIYVGKSKNGIFGRPRQHADKFKAEICYILTQEFQNTFFNDGTIQYLEHQVNQKVESSHAFINTTETTNTGTANPSDEDDCDDYLREAYKMLKVIGLDLDRVYEGGSTGENEPSAVSVDKPELPDETDLKAGEFVKQSLGNLLDSGYLSEDTFEKLCSIDGSKAITHRNLPLFWVLEDGKVRTDYPRNVISRYWSETYEYQGKSILVFSQWYPDNNIRNNAPTKQDFINWYGSL